MLAKPTLLCAIVAIACAAGGIASSQTFPNRPIRIVVGFAPAGPADVMARLIGQQLTSILGQGVVIDNRPGAGGTIGARAVAEMVKSFTARRLKPRWSSAVSRTTVAVSLTTPTQCPTC